MKIETIYVDFFNLKEHTPNGRGFKSRAGGAWRCDVHTVAMCNGERALLL